MRYETAEMQDICENIRTAIEHGRTDIIRSLLDACENGNTADGITKEKNSKSTPLARRYIPLLRFKDQSARHRKNVAELRRKSSCSKS